MPSTRIAYFAILITNLEIIFGSGKDMGEKLLNLQIENTPSFRANAMSVGIFLILF